jgi:hypothetical protein
MCDGAWVVEPSQHEIEPRLRAFARDAGSADEVGEDSLFVGVGKVRDVDLACNLFGQCVSSKSQMWQAGELYVSGVDYSKIPIMNSMYVLEHRFRVLWNQHLPFPLRVGKVYCDDLILGRVFVRLEV